MRTNLDDSIFSETILRSGRFAGARRILAGNLNLPAKSNPAQFLDANGVDRNVTLPDPDDGRFYFILNVGGAGILSVKNELGVTLTTIDPSFGALFISSYSTWHYVLNGGVTGGGGGSTVVNNVREITTPGDVTVMDDDEHILISNGVPTNVLLPLSSARSRSIKIVDLDGQASADNITILPDGSETIAGLAQWVISFGNGSVELWPRPDGLGWYI